jgi:hypothetical protein
MAKKKREYQRLLGYQDSPGMTEQAGSEMTFVASSDKGKVDRSITAMQMIYQAFGSRYPSGKPIRGIPNRRTGRRR